MDRNPVGSTPSAAADTINGFGGNDILDGGGGGDTINGGDGADTIDDGYNSRGVTNAGNIIHGDAGDDVIDVYVLGTGGANPISNFAYGDDGDDSVRLEISDFATWDGSYAFGEAPTGNVFLHGGDGNDRLEVFSYYPQPDVTVSIDGGNGSDELWATGYFAKFDEIDPGHNTDWLYGGSGDDRYHVRESMDLVIENEGAGIDKVYAHDTDYTLPANV